MEIREIRAITGLTQKAFAEKYGIPFRTVQNWEVGKDTANYRECPEYLRNLLERVAREDKEHDKAIGKKRTANLKAIVSGEVNEEFYLIKDNEYVGYKHLEELVGEDDFIDLNDFLSDGDYTPWKKYRYGERVLWIEFEQE